MITLYKYTHPSRAETVVWALQELGLDYEVKEIDGKKGEQRSPEFLAINPFGKIPAITHNGKNFTESLAIIEYLNELHSDKPLTPNREDDDFAEKNYKLRQVISFGLIEIESYLWILTKIKVLENYENWPEGVDSNCLASIQNALPIACDWLDGQEYIAGDSFTLADIYYHHLFSWLKMLGIKLPEQVKTYLKKLSARENFPSK
ncbi:glutathione S-transferase family protein [Psychrobacter sp. LV10R520-6]|uniref:glutathione S-transferase family protein n=1 Tax=Psychrobacter sp. LV10R520-6 TaxID=1415574 RepID=UPI0024CD4BA3|nr:glutathione S-transferase family protein [Psychrobacter sp. LV10R520-6]SNT69022.1 glutathione S-transferase [Psychrobacter sp. LV10R520-6]